MALVNYQSREIQFKVVYYGPGLGGKTTNLTYIHRHTPEPYRGRLVSLKTSEERTLFFDFLPLVLGEVSGYRARFQVYTVPGQMVYQASRRLILQGVDGLVFVADSSPGRQDGNLASWHDLDRSLALYDMRLRDLPLVIQWNKRDVPGALPLERLEAGLNPWRRPSFEAVAVTGTGVMQTLKASLRSVLAAFQEEARAGAEAHAAPAGGAAAGAAAAASRTARPEVVPARPDVAAAKPEVAAPRRVFVRPGIARPPSDP